MNYEKGGLFIKHRVRIQVKGGERVRYRSFHIRFYTGTGNGRGGGVAGRLVATIVIWLPVRRGGVGDQCRPTTAKANAKPAGLKGNLRSAIKAL